MVDQLCAVLDKNLRYIRDFMESRFPGVSMMLPQGTYMLFVNCGAWCRDTASRTSCAAGVWSTA